MATYVVGDIQGCFKPLKRLLKQVGFTRGRDVLWCLGDLVNRGPHSLKTLRYLYKRRDSVVNVLGNHDLHLLALAAGVTKASGSDTLDEILNAPDRQELLNWLLHCPLIHSEHGFTMVHAGIPPQWTLQEAQGYAAEVEAILQSPDCTEFLAAMYGNEPANWSDDLSGMARLRVITNYFTRMRYCTADGSLDFESKGASPLPSKNKEKEKRQAVNAWFSHKNRKTANDKILFGHWAALEGKTDTPNAIGLDTGCVWDGSLSLYCLDTGEWTRCACLNGLCRDKSTAKKKKLNKKKVTAKKAS